MRLQAYALCSVAVIILAGCVSSGTHDQTVAELDQARKASAKTATDFDSYKKQSTAQFAALEGDKTKLSNDLLASQSANAKLQRELDQTRGSLDTALASRRDLEEDVRKIRAETTGMERLNGELRRERDILQTKLDEQQQSYDASKQDLETKLKAEQATVASLQNDKELLITRAMGATDELAKAQKRMGELEAEAARAKDLDKRLADLQKRTGELETDASRAKELEQRLSQRDIEVGKLTQGGQTLAAEKEALAAEKERLEKERAAKEAEIQRLTKTQEDLTKSLQAQIDKGDIKIKQVRDRLTINMVEKVLFNSGQAQVKPEGLKVLKQVADVVKNVNDKQIRIEGHTDNVRIGGKLKEKFPTNWELSTARATNVVRYFIEQGGVNPANFEAVGYADTRPVAENETDAGRTENRRIEIVLFPKDLSAIASEIKQ
ncbi:MAG: OmpA family protein [Nitrospira sp. CR1.3]|nr:OmpA family protein [Nitrospira sp. CR1.3]